MAAAFDAFPKGKCAGESVVAGGAYRFCVLTPQLIRMEYDRDGLFEDRPTQTVVRRDFPAPAFSAAETADGLEIHTEFLSLYYDKKEFSAHGLSISVLSESRGIHSTWRFSTEPQTLGGTARTLDNADGAVPLGPGLLSRMDGYALLDDSASLALTEDGWVAPRKKGAADLYFFGYGFDYGLCLRDFFHLCGQTPLLPRYALGNWWSRYYRYSDKAYIALMDRFQEEKIPFSVAVLDMDWHITRVPAKYGKGWTGYTWNRELFPDPKAFLKKLHSLKLKVTLNLHPADGVYPHEEMYEQMALALHKDPAKGLPLRLDVSSRAFMAAYFTYLHHPREEEGVDFWWIDWQQGGVSRMEGLDPLWMLNYLHALDSGKGGRRALIFSRYAGPGSHRYPAGFSGDSVISWASLAFQPYFTATAANIGYGWWSHDIGGHLGGAKDDELAVRWLQFGVFSPIMRLHSTSNLFGGKEPWNYGEEARAVMVGFLRLRHRLLPYLYTMNWRCHRFQEQLVRPMYHLYPRQDAAYEVKNQYLFGSELMVCPVTVPMDRQLMRGKAAAWLPEGTYIDLLNGLIYRGGRKMDLYRPLNQIPVLAKAGAIVPMAGEEESTANGAALPKSITWMVFGGADGHFELYEDDGETVAYQNGAYILTSVDFLWHEKGKTCLRIKAAGPEGIIPAERRHTLRFAGVLDAGAVSVRTEPESGPVTFQKRYDAHMHAVDVALPALPAFDAVTVTFEQALVPASNDAVERIATYLGEAQIGYDLKETIYRAVSYANGEARVLAELLALHLPPDLMGILSEMILA